MHLTDKSSVQDRLIQRSMGTQDFEGGKIHAKEILEQITTYDKKYQAGNSTDGNK
ncbi:hypothetical protein F4677DRAFT_432367 [Hypoxylon crocopeplum]|nr:hypothetical protein F4677DRAFT_432367 [Hypoxylon crocopeplum]